MGARRGGLGVSPTLRAAAWMTGAIFAFSSMAVAGREISAELDTFELMLYRSVIGVGLVTGAAALTGRLGDIRARRMGLHLARNLSHFAGQNLWFLAISLIPLAQVFALEFTSPLWVAVMAPWVLGERLTRARLLALLVGFAGVLVVTRPGMIELGPGVVSAALAAIGFAGSAVLTRRLTRTEATVSILFWLTVMQAGFSLVGAGWDGRIALPSAHGAAWVGVVSVGGLVAHLCLTQALSLAPATLVIPMDFARLPLIAVVGWLAYGERIDLATALGGALIIGANLVNLRASRNGSGGQGPRVPGQD